MDRQEDPIPAAEETAEAFRRVWQRVTEQKTTPPPPPAPPRENWNEFIQQMGDELWARVQQYGEYPVFRGLRSACMRQVNRLRAAGFLSTGIRSREREARPGPKLPPEASCRALYDRERLMSRRFRRAAEQTESGELRRLFREMSEECTRHCRALWEILSQIL